MDSPIDHHSAAEMTPPPTLPPAGEVTPKGDGSVGSDIPEFEHTPRSVAHVHTLASLSQSRTHAAAIVASDLAQNAAEYRSQAVRIREILESTGLLQERLSPSAIGSAQVVATVANLLSIRDTG